MEKMFTPKNGKQAHRRRCRLDKRFNCYSPGRPCKRENKTKFKRTKPKEELRNVNSPTVEQKSN
jgi:hypothetical protein